MRSIDKYRILNRILRVSIFSAIIALYAVAYGKLWLVPVLLLVIVIGDHLWGGMSYRFSRIFIMPAESIEQVREVIVGRGFRQVDDEGLYYVKRSNYLYVYIISIEERDGRLIIDSPKRIAENIYSIGAGEISTT